MDRAQAPNLCFLKLYSQILNCTYLSLHCEQDEYKQKRLGWLDNYFGNWGWLGEVDAKVRLALAYKVDSA